MKERQVDEGQKEGTGRKTNRKKGRNQGKEMINDNKC